MEIKKLYLAYRKENAAEAQKWVEIIPFKVKETGKIIFTCEEK